MTSKQAFGQESQDKIAAALGALDLATHRRLLDFFNGALRPEDLVEVRSAVTPPGGHHDALDPVATEATPINIELAERLLKIRDADYPLGFRSLREVVAVKVIPAGIWEAILAFFGYRRFGRWQDFPQDIPLRGGQGYDGVVHAAVLHTGRVLFIAANETTVLWNPDDTTPASFEDPVNQPQQVPDAASGYSVLCGGHSILTNGNLLVVGGGGYGPHERAKWGYKFDPLTKTWSRTSGSMEHSRWYPTVLTLGDRRTADSREVLVVCGHGDGDMEIYDEATDSFRQVTAGDDKPFPNLYPGLHLLPNHSIFYSRTGWATAGPGGGPFHGDDQSSYFRFTASSTGVWNDIAPVQSTMPDRTKGMSVMLLSNSPPHVRILVLGGADPATNQTYEMLDATTLSNSVNWSPATNFPDGEHRSLCSAVLLPDGSVFVCGGIQRTNSPCALFDPTSNSWSAMAALPSIRDYHSVAILLPSGQVAVAGWFNKKIEIFDPPYLFRGPRPEVTVAPSHIHYGKKFTIDSPHADAIAKVVLVRPMAVTHETDTEQKVLELCVHHASGHGKRLTLVAPDGSVPHSLAQRGFYMLFAVSHQGVPSVAHWVYLH